MTLQCSSRNPYDHHLEFATLERECKPHLVIAEVDTPKIGHFKYLKFIVNFLVQKPAVLDVHTHSIDKG